ncbi:MAG: hypothetical protein KKC05_03440 [Nanoarchaeota archaeon]|nr:hypothetical protein [Nanoarchaeota archaeon]
MPEKNVYVKIKEDIRLDFFNFIKSNHGGAKKLSKSCKNIKLTNSHIYNWRRGINFIPLEILNKFLSILEKKDKLRYQNLISTNIEKLKSGSNSRNISNVKFPIKFSTNLARIAGHLVGDGGISATGEEKYTTYYSNKCYDLIKLFKDDIEKNFGNIKIYVFFDKRYKVFQIKLPKIVGIILAQFFGFQANDLKHVPKVVSQSDKIYKSLFLQALFDDEANVDKSGRKITIMMTNRKIIRDVKCILNSLNITTGEVKEIKKTKDNRQSIFGFYITHNKNFLEFHEEIGFSHPNKKANLKSLIEDYHPHYENGEMDKNIIKLLRNKRMTALELSIELERSCSRTKQKLQELERNNIIKAIVAKQNLKIYHM